MSKSWIPVLLAGSAVITLLVLSRQQGQAPLPTKAEGKSCERSAPTHTALCLKVKPMTPGELEEIQRTTGKKETKELLQDLFESEERAELNRWNRILCAIESGVSAWIRVGARFRAVSDSGTSDDLNEALAMALEKNPAEVLRQLEAIPPESVTGDDGGLMRYDTGYYLNEVCGITPEVYLNTPECLAEWSAERIKQQEGALMQVQDKKLEKIKKKCLAAVLQK